MPKPFPTQTPDKVLLTAVDVDMQVFIITIHSSRDPSTSIGVALSLPILLQLRADIDFGLSQLQAKP